MSYVYIKSESAGKAGAVHDLYTVGFYEPNGTWRSASDHTHEEDAAARVRYLNGGRDAPVSETSTSDTTRLEWLFSKLNDAEIKRKVQAVSDVHMEGAVHGIRLADWRHAIDVARIQFVEKP